MQVSVFMLVYDAVTNTISLRSTEILFGTQLYVSLHVEKSIASKMNIAALVSWQVPFSITFIQNYALARAAKYLVLYLQHRLTNYASRVT